MHCLVKKSLDGHSNLLYLKPSFASDTQWLVPRARFLRHQSLSPKGGLSEPLRHQIQTDSPICSIAPSPGIFYQALSRVTHQCRPLRVYSRIASFTCYGATGQSAEDRNYQSG